VGLGIDPVQLLSLVSSPVPGKNLREELNGLVILTVIIVVIDLLLLKLKVAALEKFLILAARCHGKCKKNE